MFGRTKLTIELLCYSTYRKLNKQRKGSEKNPLYKFVDDVRRQIGYVK